MTRRPALLRVLPVLALVLAGAGCGGGSAASPADRVPTLQSRLDAVDRAVTARDYDSARTALDRLEQAADRAERSGTLDSAVSAAIVSAADRLLTALPARPEPSADSSSTGSASPTLDPSPEQDTPDSPEPPGHETGKPPGHAKPPKEPKGHGPGPKHAPKHGPKHGPKPGKH
ncbi:hypothetical protein [Nocardioides panaciterrulae]|uniref:Uncharacterized protein n=1 Tax=Nocardioides panaciterrulae TaxID=661492 RepID=A0A7Y9JBU2_9ACTN|nr:hypothetical protein [Nocardioides panaciterrulae]NYD43162.1 hypothetical protein [Nocardioides panaciterrulae]